MIGAGLSQTSNWDGKRTGGAAANTAAFHEPKVSTAAMEGFAPEINSGSLTFQGR